jgi:hypothetical protein
MHGPSHACQAWRQQQGGGSSWQLSTSRGLQGRHMAAAALMLGWSLAPCLPDPSCLPQPSAPAFSISFKKAGDKEAERRPGPTVRRAVHLAKCPPAALLMLANRPHLPHQQELPWRACQRPGPTAPAPALRPPPHQPHRAVRRRPTAPAGPPAAPGWAPPSREGGASRRGTTAPPATCPARGPTRPSAARRRAAARRPATPSEVGCRLTRGSLLAAWPGWRHSQALVGGGSPGAGSS